MMSLTNKELEEWLKAAGNALSQPSSSLGELLCLLDRAEKFLSKVEQSPSKSMLTAISPLMEALSTKDFVKHSDVDVRVSVASCISEITRITAPDVPFEDDKMKEVFHLIVSCFKDLVDTSSRSYYKRVSILETMAKVRYCLIMLDLEMDQLIIEMFQHFLRATSVHQPETVVESMEAVMSLVLEESDDTTSALITPIIVATRRNNEETLPYAKKLAEKVIQNCTQKLGPYLTQALQASDKEVVRKGAPVFSDFLENQKQVAQEKALEFEERDQMGWKSTIGRYPGLGAMPIIGRYSGRKAVKPGGYGAALMKGGMAKGRHAAWFGFLIKGSMIYWVHKIEKEFSYRNWEWLQEELIQRYNGLKATHPYKLIAALMEPPTMEVFIHEEHMGYCAGWPRDGGWICERVLILIDDKDYWEYSWARNRTENWAQKIILGRPNKCILHFASRPSNRAREEEIPRRWGKGIARRGKAGGSPVVGSGTNGLLAVGKRAGQKQEKISTEELKIQKAEIADYSERATYLSSQVGFLGLGSDGSSSTQKNSRYEAPLLSCTFVISNLIDGVIDLVETAGAKKLRGEGGIAIKLIVRYTSVDGGYWACYCMRPNDKIGCGGVEFVEARQFEFIDEHFYCSPTVESRILTWLGEEMQKWRVLDQQNRTTAGNFATLSAFKVFLESSVNLSQYNEVLIACIWVDEIIQSLVKLGGLTKGLELINQKKICRVSPNGFVYNFLIGGLGRERRVDGAKKLLNEMLKRIVELCLNSVEAETNNVDPCNKNGTGGFDPVYEGISALVSIVVFCDDVGDQAILSHVVKVLSFTINTGVQQLHWAGEDGKCSSLIVIVSEVFDANKKWDRGREVNNSLEDGKGSSPIIIIGEIIDANKTWDRGREVTISVEDTFGKVGALCSQIMEKGSTSKNRLSTLSLEDKANLKGALLLRTQLLLGLDI